jgi:hypothetical protein
VFYKARRPVRVRIVVGVAALLTIAGAARAGTAERASIRLSGLNAIAVSPASGRILVGLEGRFDSEAGRTLWWSDDHGRQWRLARGLGAASGITALAFSRSRPDVVYAGALWSTPKGLRTSFLVSNDAGASWRAGSWREKVDVVGSVLTASLPAVVDELVVDPSAPDTVYADTHGVLRRTLDGGKTWTRIGLRRTLDRSPLSIQLATDSGGTLYYAAGVDRGLRQVYRSSDHGTSWQPAGRGLPRASPGSGLLQLVGDLGTRPGNVYTTTRRGIYATRGRDGSWVRIARVGGAIDVGPGGLFLYGTVSGRAGLFRLASTGTWTWLSNPRVGGNGFTLQGFALDPSSSSRVYAWWWTEDDDNDVLCTILYTSGDGGVTWAAVDRTLPLAQRNCGKTR